MKILYKLKCRGEKVSLWSIRDSLTGQPEEKSTDDIMSRVREHIEVLQDYVEDMDYAGYDPYDALRSSFIKFICRRSKWSRIIATQFFRRSPINARTLFGINKGHNPKGLGLFLWGYAKLYGIYQQKTTLERIDRLLDLLETCKCPHYSGNCWGYNFDWQSRTCWRPEGVPTIVNTSFIGHALLDCYYLTKSDRALQMTISIKDFILQDLNRTKTAGGFCFSYTPIDNAVIHNANLLGTSILARLNAVTKDERLIPAITNSLAYSMKCQRHDGSWYYADTDCQRWIDSFHTGFNLQAIRYILQAGYALNFQEAYQRGVRYYAESFFHENGTPKYYHDRTYPIDIHAPAQAICFFSQENGPYHDLTDRIVDWMLKNMYSGKGFFYYRKGRFLTNRISYMRWSQAWVFHGLTELLYARSRRRPDANTGTTYRKNGARRTRDLLSIA